MKLNFHVLEQLCIMWVHVYDFDGTPKTPPLHSLQTAAAPIHHRALISECLVSLRPELQPEVRDFWKKMTTNTQDMPPKVQIHAESWGLKKLVSYLLRQCKRGHTARVGLSAADGSINTSGGFINIITSCTLLCRTLMWKLFSTSSGWPGA